jgi:hypothetical protein
MAIDLIRRSWNALARSAPKMTTIAGNPASIVCGEFPPVVADKDKLPEAHKIGFDNRILNAYQFHKDSGP